MAHDGSIASQVEDWIVTQVKAITFGGRPAFDPKSVEPWVGTEAGSVRQVAEELFQGTRNRICRVFYLSDQQAIALADGEMKTVPVYVILIGIKDFDPGAARRGSVRGGTKEWGTNAMRDRLKVTFNQAQPDVDDGVTHTDVSQYLGSEIVLLVPNKCIMQARITVDEVPIGA